MAWYYAPDNIPPFGGPSPFMMGQQPPYSERTLEKEIRKLTGIYEEMKSAKKKKETKKPRVFTFLETIGVTVLAGPVVFVCYTKLVEVLAVLGANFVNNLNVPH